MAKLINEKRSYGIVNDSENNNSNMKRVSFYRWKDRDNNIRLIGQPVMVRTYYLPKSAYNPADIFVENAFDKETNEHYLPKMINCPDWNIQDRKFENNGDVLRSLNKIANEMLKIGKQNGLPADQIKKWEDIRNKTISTVQYKWLCFDRDLPYVIEDGRIKEPKQLVGYQIITFSKSLFEMVVAAQESYGDDDIYDIDKGCDLVIKKSVDAKTKKAVWSVQLKMNGRTVSETPLTDEERALQMPNLMELSNKQVPNELIMNNLQPQYVEMLNDPNFSQIINNNNYKPTPSTNKSAKNDLDEVPF